MVVLTVTSRMSNSGNLRMVVPSLEMFDDGKMENEESVDQHQQ